MDKAVCGGFPKQANGDAIDKLIAYICTCKKYNRAEWMAGLADVLNAAIEANGSDDRVEWPGSWANEFNLVSGG